MDNQTPPVENIVQPAVSTEPTTAPPSSKSFLSNKSILIVIILIILLGAGGTYLAMNSQSKPAPTVSQTTPSPTEASAKVGAPTVDPTASWKTYQTDRFSISYPENWIVNTSIPELFNVSFRSPDFLPGREGIPNYLPGVEEIQKGLVVNLFINKAKLQDIGTTSSSKIVWLSENATLSTHAYEGLSLVLGTAHKGIYYQMALGVATPQIKDEDRNLFITMANSLKLK